MERKKIGEVFHFFGKIGVAAIRLTDGSVALGDTVQIQGPTTNLEQTVEELQIEHTIVSSAQQGQEVGMRVPDRVREKDFVFKVVPPAAPSASKATAPKPPAPKATPLPTKKAGRARAKKATRAPTKRARRAPTRKANRAPAKKVRGARAKKATRAPSKKARRGSRGSRRRSR